MKLDKAHVLWLIFWFAFFANPGMALLLAAFIFIIWLILKYSFIVLSVILSSIGARMQRRAARREQDRSCRQAEREYQEWLRNQPIDPTKDQLAEAARIEWERAKRRIEESGLDETLLTELLNREQEAYIERLLEINR